MTTAAIEIVEALSVEVCANCGIAFGFPEGYGRKLRETHRDFYCPNGHSQHYPQKTEAEKLREKLQLREEELNNAWGTVRDVERKAKRLENDLLDEVKKHASFEEKVKAGLCPYCHRSFVNVRRHMHNKHGSDEQRTAEIASSVPASRAKQKQPA